MQLRWPNSIFNRKRGWWWWFSVPNLTFLTPPKGKMNSSGYNGQKGIIKTLHYFSILVVHRWWVSVFQVKRVGSTYILMQCLTWNVTWIDEGLWTFFCQIIFWIVTLSFSCFQTHSQLCRVTSFKLATVPVVKVNSSLYQNILYLLLNHIENALKIGAGPSITKQNWLLQFCL